MVYLADADASRIARLMNIVHGFIAANYFGEPQLWKQFWRNNRLHAPDGWRTSSLYRYVERKYTDSRHQSLR
jgi:hypothetical protein